MFNRTTNTVTDLEAQAAALTGPATDFARHAADQAADLAFDAKKARKYSALSAEFAEHQREIQKLAGRIEHLQKTSRGGGFPWTLLLLLGGAYALYRSNETVRTQVNGLLSRVMPSQQDEQTQGSPQAPKSTSVPTVNADMTPGGSGNEAFGMAGTPSTGTPASESSNTTNLGGTAPTASLGNSNTSTNVDNKNNGKQGS